jgi:TfoX/Sxy family transcriptional regulator of competence genes
MAKTSEEARQAFREIVPGGPGVTVRPMFGSLAAFLNGRMFAGVFGEDLFVRATESQREALLSQGASDFMPMPGRVMSGYVSLPGGWRADPGPAARALADALAVTAEMPPKPAKAAGRKKKGQ